MNEQMTTGQFIEALWKQALHANNEDSGFSLFSYGRTRGWLEEIDELEQDSPLERRSAARIIHQFLKLECGERDEANWEAAKVLLDLYDCRVCVNHVAQVYVKGIMEPAMEHIFGMRMGVNAAEAKDIIARVFLPERRRRVIL